MGTPARNGVVFSNLGPMLPPLGAGNVVGAHRREQRLRNRAFRNIERQPGTPPEVGNRAIRPAPSGTSSGTPAGTSSRPGQQRLACVRGRLCCASPAVLCRTAMAVHGFSTLHLGRWNLFFAILVRAAPGNPDKCLQRSLLRQPCRKSWPSSVCVSLCVSSWSIDVADWTWESLVELGGRAASGILIAWQPVPAGVREHCRSPKPSPGPSSGTRQARGNSMGAGVPPWGS